VRIGTQPILLTVLAGKNLGPMVDRNTYPFLWIVDLKSTAIYVTRPRRCRHSSKHIEGSRSNIILIRLFLVSFIIVFDMHFAALISSLGCISSAYAVGDVRSTVLSPRYAANPNQIVFDCNVMPRELIFDTSRNKPILILKQRCAEICAMVVQTYFLL
jgi:hypothetical protein